MMGSQSAAAGRRAALGLLALAALWCSIPSVRGEAADGGGGGGSGGAAAVGAGGGGGGRLLLAFEEARGNVSFRCSPSGPCLPCQYSEKNDDKYRCSETGYRVPLKCVQIKESMEEASKSMEEASKIDSRRKLSSPQEHASAVQKQLFTTLSNYKWRKLLDHSSQSDSGEVSYITYRSCLPVGAEEKLSVLGFEVIMVGLLLISGSVVYLRQKRPAVMAGVAPVRVPTSPPRF